jgi:hypothetical protein
MVAEMEGEAVWRCRVDRVGKSGRAAEVKKSMYVCSTGVVAFWPELSSCLEG